MKSKHPQNTRRPYVIETEQLVLDTEQLFYDSKISSIPSSIPLSTVRNVFILKGRENEATGVHVRVRSADNVIYSCILTCLHVLKSKQYATTIVARNSFFHTKLSPDKVYIRARDQDLVVCAMKDIPPYRGMDIRKTDPQRVKVLQNPDGSGIRVSEGSVLRYDYPTLFHNASTLPGSSGGAVISKSKNNKAVLSHIHCQTVTSESWRANIAISISVMNPLLKEHGFSWVSSY